MTHHTKSKLNASSSPAHLMHRPHLSKRETECLQLTIRGQSARLVAKHLGISQRTVEEYLNNTKIKFGVSSKRDLIDIAIDYFFQTDKE